MIAVDELLWQRHEQGNPVKVALVGAGAAARMIALHFSTSLEGIRLVAIADRTLARANERRRRQA